MSRYGEIAFTVLIFLICLQLGFSQLPSDQISTMNRVYEMIKNDTGTLFVWNNVTKDSSPCSWKGVFCTPDNSSIIKLSFHLFSISGSEFLPVICQIGTLESLDLSDNYLSSIPAGFITNCGEISGLRLLNFSSNKLVGSLLNFNGFGMLEHLDFSQNSLTGEINSQFIGLDSLKILNLSKNYFEGNVPTNLGKYSLLEELQLSFNQFTGTIPSKIIKYGNLGLIDLSVNNLSGRIPDEFGGLSKLKILILSLNNLSGGIPKSLSNITTLLRFAANQNNFSETIPAGITSYLRSLDLSYNKLSGTIPSDLLSGTNLQSIDLSYNKLEGSIPANISTRLFRLRLGRNSLNGTLPGESMRSLTELTYLELDNNSLIGSIPPEIGMCTNLALLNLAQNRLSGPLPPSLGNLINLQVLNLQSNNFVGEIPIQITMLHRLQRVKISWNSLNGSIPDSISNLQNLTNLDLQGNSLRGSIPNSIGTLNNLLELQLGKNQLSGHIPAMPQNLQIALNLSNNLFEGNIPVTLSRLTGLEVLDLSNNRFSGKIPEFLTKMTTLTQLDLANNLLSGAVPQFGNFVHVVTDGNKDLMKTTRNPPPASQRKRKSVASDAVIAAAAAVIAVGLLTMISLLISRRYYRINDEHLDSGEETSQLRVVQENLLTANSIHRSNIDFSKAMEAVANPSNIFLKSRFSTYYKAVMPSGASYFVKKLNWSDKIFQLGSHEKFGEELEILGKLCNSNVMIPLAYALTVDSAYLFYEFAPKGTLSDALHVSLGNSPLEWASRYSVSIGVAQGLAFLHGCNSGPVLLLDLSSKTILLKSPNEPQVGDIELCKVIDPSKSTGSLSTIAGSVGYIPPEYAYTMRVTAAGNVYSFGVILLELLTGKPPVSGGTELAKAVLSNSAQQNNWDQILDFSVSKTSAAIKRQMLAVLKVALACVSISPDERPNMKSVLRMLLNAR
ncbi:leucine-rich repeat transmembrane protein kinase family protein [Forsythia ovata]|uniref:Leucine-rich repeat transmembrane protein kinase family protein n=1 Tax=Forsythia ovata TaxID=205694 RepID=A0ABD1PUE6_9LAMI